MDDSAECSSVHLKRHFLCFEANVVRVSCHDLCVHAVVSCPEEMIITIEARD